MERNILEGRMRCIQGKGDSVKHMATEQWKLILCKYIIWKGNPEDTCGQDIEAPLEGSLRCKAGERVTLPELNKSEIVYLQ
ncbi:hypothetical protein M514_12192 [Trichuris suis]|uniref:Uncharacterized protein n=1 Tax=Trichuris suis TaxID=68888 RepID=A0A085MYC1_9BILA|nr:hypothetical protein M513_12192 [Trichuris suis]KFD62217.1 hypothetical protein M514_12192 [Trichuris suis]